MTHALLSPADVRLPVPATLPKALLNLKAPSGPSAIRISASADMPRGLLSSRIQANGPDPKTILASLTQGFQEFKDNHNAQMGEMQSAYDDMQKRLSAALIRPGEDGDAAQFSSRQVQAARDAFGGFAKRGDQASIDAMHALAPRAAMQTGSNSDGGFLIPQELDSTILELQRNISPIRRLARVVQTNTANFEIPVNLQGTGSGWVGETATRPQTTSPTLTMLQFPVGEIYAMPGASQRLLDDAPQNIASWLESEIATEFDKQEGIGFLSGNGVNKPLGLLSGTPSALPDATRPFGTYQSLPSGAAASIQPDAMIDMVYSLKAGYRQNATWLMNSATIGKVRKLKDGQGNYLWQQSLIQGQPDRILGYPVEAEDLMPDAVAGSLPIAFGDFRRGYLITDRLGIRILRDPLTAKPFVLFYATKRVGGGPLDTNAVKFMQVSAN